ncbi:hypothetical protein F4780DRAFT_359731 [Xylariomycetidae sp. FL0641]|nr:hypothetical protein F4780DRAFT_359731 [Xylariomycetidae sp. FL0641]
MPTQINPQMWDCGILTLEPARDPDERKERVKKTLSGTLGQFRSDDTPPPPCSIIEICQHAMQPTAPHPFLAFPTTTSQLAREGCLYQVDKRPPTYVLGRCDNKPDKVVDTARLMNKTDDWAPNSGHRGLPVLSRGFSAGGYRPKMGYTSKKIVDSNPSQAAGLGPQATLTQQGLRVNGNPYYGVPHAHSLASLAAWPGLASLRCLCCGFQAETIASRRANDIASNPRARREREGSDCRAGSHWGRYILRSCIFHPRSASPSPVLRRQNR